jgi:hypothetical protein
MDQRTMATAVAALTVGLGLAVCIAALPAAAAAQTDGSGGGAAGSVIAGRVVDAVTNQPVAGAEIRLDAGPTVAVATDSGTFVLHDVPPGSHAVEVSAQGYLTWRGSVELAADVTTRLEIALQPDPVVLPEIDVEARARLDPRLVGFWERRERGSGYYFTRGEIERERPARIADLFRKVPGARVARTSAMGEGHVVSFGRAPGGASNICPAVVYLDGRIYPLNETGMDEIRPEEIEAIEAYPGAARLPPQFNQSRSSPSRPGQLQGNPVCGVIVLWTRRR